MVYHYHISSKISRLSGRLQHLSKFSQFVDIKLCLQLTVWSSSWCSRVFYYCSRTSRWVEFLSVRFHFSGSAWRRYLYNCDIKYWSKGNEVTKPVRQSINVWTIFVWCFVRPQTKNCWNILNLIFSNLELFWLNCQSKFRMPIRSSLCHKNQRHIAITVTVTVLVKYKISSFKLHI